MTENLDGVNVHVNAEGNITMSSKKSSCAWMFTVTSKVSRTTRKIIPEYFISAALFQLYFRKALEGFHWSGKVKENHVLVQ